MAEHQLPHQVGDFARYFRTVTGRLDAESGWCGVFWRRDPDGLTACLRGAEVPPWDVVESLLHDLAADDEEMLHARGLHAAAATAHDRRPGGGEALRERLELMRREQAHAAERGRELLRRLSSVPEGSPAYRDLAHDLSWANDDHTRATSRCAELATRIAALAQPPGPPSGRAPYDLGRAPVPGSRDPAASARVFGANPSAPDPGPDAARSAVPTAEPGAAEGGSRPWAGHLRGPAPLGTQAPAGAGGADGGAAGRDSGGTSSGAGGTGAWARPVADAGAAEGWGRVPSSPGTQGGRDASGESVDEAPQAPGGGAPDAGRAPGREARRGGRRRPRGARYAWLDEEAEEAGAEPVPGLPEQPVTAVRPRGARFRGAADAEPAAPAGRKATAPAGEEDRRAALATVATLGRLRAAGRGGEAHVLLCEAASGPAARLPLLAAELHRCGLGADWPTLLWEVASLPPERLAEAAGALAGAGRDEDCGRLLRQGVARPAGEIADAVLALGDAGGRREADALLAAFLRVRTPEEGARIAAADPHRLVPQLLSAARAVSPGRERDLVHALRVAGLLSA
ncbi:hypothetical protein [Streptomyces sp. WMMC940]|uniref:hypothetical protein n=1 Tax=Streptomyces sp. WMMC940 TaxID=3015153 RepID=UPI0022B69BDD|nr:hypothetical protein [Streptomyces sp. WMMC940]MCZ7457061.1 hypothetical protein [Streptomyces sp. WMMC940]